VSFSIPRCVLFDLDGTLLDSLPGIVHSVNHACREVGLPKPEEDFRTLLGPPIRKIFAKVVCTENAEQLDRLEAVFRLHYDAEGWRKTRCFAGARETLELLKGSGRRLFVASNKPIHISLEILENESLLPLFETIYTRDSRQPPYTSKTEMVGDLLNVHSVRCSECLLVGDTMEDIQAAMGNGIDAVLMEHGYGEVSPDVPVRYRVRNFAEFLDCAEMGVSS